MREEMGWVGVRPLLDDDRPWARRLMAERWGGEEMVIRGRLYRPAEHQGFVAHVDGDRIGLLTYAIEGKACEVLSLDSLREGRGVGTALLEMVKDAAREAGCDRIRLITTNDNLDALRFYQKRGFVLVALHC